MSPAVRVGEIPTLVSNLIDQLVQRLTTGNALEHLIVGLVGAPGSGKSTTAKQLKTGLKAAGAFAGLVAMDDFYLSNTVLDELGRRGRKGAPDTFDVEGYLTTLDRVRTDGVPQVLVPVYRCDMHESVAARSIAGGTDVIVIEGGYLALEARGQDAARERIGLLIHIDVPEEVLVPRFINWHEDFGKNPLAAGYWVHTANLPNTRPIATNVRRCSEVWHESEGKPKPDVANRVDGADDDLEQSPGLHWPRRVHRATDVGHSRRPVSSPQYSRLRCVRTVN